MKTIEAPEKAVVVVVAERLESPDWYALLDEAVKEPGQLAAAHKFFHQYSLANRWLASTQLRAAGLPLMPINTFKGWLNAKRPVMKGQKASVALIMPVPVKGKKKDDEDESRTVFTRFMLRKFWFALAQTDGEEYNPDAVERADWNLTAALGFLEIKECVFEFDSINDKRLGWARGHEISVSPLDAHQTFARLREMARIVLGHTAATPTKAVPDDQELRDVEAETTAYLCAATFGFSGLEESRSRLQAYLAGGVRMRIPDKCAHRAFSAADKLINAGYC